MGGRPKKTQENPKNPMGYDGEEENPKNPKNPKNLDIDIGIGIDSDIGIGIDSGVRETKRKRFSPPTLVYNRIRLYTNEYELYR